MHDYLEIVMSLINDRLNEKINLKGAEIQMLICPSLEPQRMLISTLLTQIANMFTFLFVTIPSEKERRQENEIRDNAHRLVCLQYCLHGRIFKSRL